VSLVEAEEVLVEPDEEDVDVDRLLSLEEVPEPDVEVPELDDMGPRPCSFIESTK